MEIQDSLDSRLDLALDLTFPASDPISVYIPDRDDYNGITEPNPAAVTPDDEWGVLDARRIGLV